MKVPFSAEQFFEVFKAYNTSVFPMQIVLLVLSLFSIYLLIYPTNRTSKIINAILSFYWLWMGIVYHLIYFSQINPAAYLFGGVFILQGLLFLYLGVFKNTLTYKYQSNWYGIAALALFVYALLIYPLLGYYFGHAYPSSPTFGLPCPTTIFTFGILLFTNRCPITIIIIPFIWSILGLSAVSNFGVIEDGGLIIAGLITSILLLLRRKTFHKISGDKLRISGINPGFKQP